jgi:hypothetical protein
MKTSSYIQKEHEKIYGDKSPFSDDITFHIVKTFYLGERLKLKCERIMRNVRCKHSK